MNSKDIVIPVLVICVLVICVLVIVGSFFLLVEENKQWESFKIEHHCKLVTHISGDVFNTIGIDAKGNVSIGVGATPDKEGWACDDGITHYR